MVASGVPCQLWLECYSTVADCAFRARLELRIACLDVLALGRSAAAHRFFWVEKALHSTVWHGRAATGAESAGVKILLGSRGGAVGPGGLTLGNA